MGALPLFASKLNLLLGTSITLHCQLKHYLSEWICCGYKITFKAHVHVCPSDWNAANLVAEQILRTVFHQGESKVQDYFLRLKLAQAYLMKTKLIAAGMVELVLPAG